MSGNNNYSDWYEEDLDQGQEQSGRGLRKQLEDALGELRSLRAELNAEKQAKTLDGLLKEKGIDPRVKDIMPKDADPADWLDKYASITGSHLDTNEVPKTPEAELAPDLKAELEAQAQMAPTGGAAGGTTTQQDPLQQLAALKTEEEFLTFLNQQKSENYSDGGLWG